MQLMKNRYTGTKLKIALEGYSSINLLTEE